jgi:hypothetical protein
VLGGLGCQRHAPALLPPGMTWYPFCRRLCGLDGRSGWARKISPPFFCSLFLLYLYFFVVIVLALAFCPYCTTYTTQHPCPGGIRTRNPSKRSAADSRPKPHGHWDDRFRLPDCPSRSESLYRLSDLGPQVDSLVNRKGTMRARCSLFVDKIFN